MANKYVNVRLTFDIPVMVDESDDGTDAYYAARDVFSNYRVNDASVDIIDITEADYKAAMAVVERFRKFNEGTK